MSVCVRGFLRGRGRGSMRVYAFAASPVVGVENVCVYAFVPFPVVGVEAVRVCLRSRLPMWWGLRTYVCMPSWHPPWWGSRTYVFACVRGFLMCWRSKTHVYVCVHGFPVGGDRGCMCVNVHAFSLSSAVGSSTHVCFMSSQAV